MSVGAICFTSSGSNGGCWVVLVFPRPFFGKMGFFFPYATYAKKKKVYATYTKKKINFRRKKKRDLRQKKKSYATYAKKKNKKATYAYFHNRVTLSSPSTGTADGGVVCLIIFIFSLLTKKRTPPPLQQCAPPPALSAAGWHVSSSYSSFPPLPARRQRRNGDTGTQTGIATSDAGCSTTMLAAFRGRIKFTGVHSPLSIINVVCKQRPFPTICK